MKLKQTLVLVIGLLALQAVAQDKKPAPVPQPGGPPPSSPRIINPGMKMPDLKPVTQDKGKISYAIGMNIAGNLKFMKAVDDIEVETLAKAMQDVFSGKATRMTDNEAMEIIQPWQMQKQRELPEKNEKAGEEFLAKKAKEPGVKVLPSGLGYKVIKEGAGPIPKSSDIITANYRGTLVDGTEFDSSAKRNQPLETAVTGVIPGWTEALQLMKVGSKWELYIPQKLAYGERGQRPKIGPKSALIFEMELLSIKEPQKPLPTSLGIPKTPGGTNEVVSGEIIKVPSEAERKKGAKIEIIKAAQTNTVPPKK